MVSLVCSMIMFICFLIVARLMLYLHLLHISYSAEVWGNTYLSKILHVLLKQKKAVRIIARTEYLDHTEKLFYNMKLLTVNQIIELLSLTFTYKTFKGLLLVNLQTHFTLNTGKKRYQNSFKCQYSRTTE